MMRTTAHPSFLGAALALSACGASHSGPAAPVTGGPANSAAQPPAPAAQASDEAQALITLTASCWFGGTWADSLGEQGAVKESAIESRCRDLERRVWGGATDNVHYEQLRALEMNAVADVIAKVDETARSEGPSGAARRDALVKLTTALAEEQRELMAARRASDRVKRDLDREPEKLNPDEVAAVAPFRAHAKLDALLALEAGDLSREANALGLLCALDRVELARGLPKHLKLYAVADAFHGLFGVDIPRVPQDATEKLVPGTWLRFLSETAKAAGHPVSASASTPRERDALAWAGMLEGFSDKLKNDTDGLPPGSSLGQVVTVALHRLDAEYRAQLAAESTLHASNPK
jgi:hypothetical protein